MVNLRNSGKVKHKQTHVTLLAMNAFERIIHISFTFYDCPFFQSGTLQSAFIFRGKTALLYPRETSRSPSDVPCVCYHVAPNNDSLRFVASWCLSVP